jgi:hypothetical protein
MDTAPFDLPSSAKSWSLVMSAPNRLSRFGSIVRERALPAWKLAVHQTRRYQHWLTLRPQAQVTLFSIGMGVVTLLLLIFSGVTAAVASLAAWVRYDSAFRANECRSSAPDHGKLLKGDRATRQ